MSSSRPMFITTSQSSTRRHHPHAMPRRRPRHLSLLVVCTLLLCVLPGVSYAQGSHNGSNGGNAGVTTAPVTLGPWTWSFGPVPTPSSSSTPKPTPSSSAHVGPTTPPPTTSPPTTPTPTTTAPTTAPPTTSPPTTAPPTTQPPTTAPTTTHPPTTAPPTTAPTTTAPPTTKPTTTEPATTKPTTTAPATTKPTSNEPSTTKPPETEAPTEAPKNDPEEPIATPAFRGAGSNANTATSTEAASTDSNLPAMTGSKNGKSTADSKSKLPTTAIVTGAVLCLVLVIGVFMLVQRGGGKSKMEDSPTSTRRGDSQSQLYQNYNMPTSPMQVAPMTRPTVMRNRATSNTVPVMPAPVSTFHAQMDSDMGDVSMIDYDDPMIDALTPKSDIDIAQERRSQSGSINPLRPQMHSSFTESEMMMHDSEISSIDDASTVRDNSVTGRTTTATNQREDTLWSDTISENDHDDVVSVDIDSMRDVSSVYTPSQRSEQSTNGWDANASGMSEFSDIGQTLVSHNGAPPRQFGSDNFSDIESEPDSNARSKRSASLRSDSYGEDNTYGKDSLVDSVLSKHDDSSSNLGDSMLSDSQGPSAGSKFANTNRSLGDSLRSDSYGEDDGPENTSFADSLRSDSYGDIDLRSNADSMIRFSDNEDDDDAIFRSSHD